LPELPEVDTVRRGLAPALVGARIAKAQTRRADVRFPFPARFAARLKGRRVEALTRRAKYLLAELDDGQAWVTHLGMTGRWSIAGARKQPGDFYYSEPPDARHTHVVVALEGGVVLEFNDPRRFGYMDLIASEALDTHAWFKGLGPEPLGNAFHAAHLAAAFEAKKTSIKAALMDQRVVAGLGNIYVCEALYRAGISPRRAAGRVSAARLEVLAREVRGVLEEAILAGGSTLSDYAQVNGAAGAFQQRFAVYDREGARCISKTCGGTIARLVQSGRSSFYCSRCQR
jgi:formamidopyrimidine-DNA glycosylase